MTQAEPVSTPCLYMLTRRCTQRQLLLRPDEEVNQIWRYCLAEAASRHDVDVVFSTLMSNHHHTIVYDRRGDKPRIIDFTADLHRNVAKCINALRGREENLWSSEPPHRLKLLDAQVALKKMVYAAVNPVAAGLVERAHHWPGVDALSDFVNDRSTRVKRPRHYFRSDGTMPAEVTLRYVVPPMLGVASEVRESVRVLVHEEEAKLLRDRRLHGRRVMGRRAVLRQRCTDVPSTPEPRGRRRPLIAATSPEVLAAARLELRLFRAAYREARKAFAAGEPALFPPGTYWVRRYAGAQVAQVAPVAQGPPS